MVDRVSKEIRSRIMSNIKGKDTKPEMVIRRSLHALGYRYRLHNKELPGKPDLVFAKYNAVVLVNGCFWHGHNCHIFNMPKSKTKYWEDKIGRNINRDKKNREAIFSLGWRIATVWECAVFGKTSIPTEILINLISEWLKSNQQEINIEGNPI